VTEPPTATAMPARCVRCEQPYGTCHHTAPPFVVGDTIRAGAMSSGAWVRAGELRPNSRVRDAEGNVWVKTRRRDGAWESLTDGAIWSLDMICDERQGYGVLTVEHVAGRQVSAKTLEANRRAGANLRRVADVMIADPAAVVAVGPESVTVFTTKAAFTTPGDEEADRG